MYNVNVELTEGLGIIKPLHGVCCAPYSLNGGKTQNMIDAFFKEGGIPFCRLHDCCYPYGWGQFIDVTKIFPDFSANENDENNYNFHYSDEYISAIRKTGCEVYYRLGESIEWGSKKISTVIPSDPAKWARICEHIVMHYNEGWGNGFNYDIKYWEIWNEPENPGSEFGSSMWQGSEADFFKLYAITSKHLKKRFPSLKIGGYGSCGFYTQTRTDTPKGFELFIPYFERFLKMVKENSCPLDFFSWHIYSASVDELVKHAFFARKTLDGYGFTDTESHLNEWNFDGEGKSFAEKHTTIAAAFNCAVFSALQNTRYVDKAMYYCFSNESRYNGFVDRNGGKTDIPWYSIVAFNKLYSLGNCVKATSDSSGIYAVAAIDKSTAAAGDGRAAVMITNFNSESETLHLNINGIDIIGGEKTVSVKLIDDGAMLKKILTVNTNKKFTAELELRKNTVLLLEIE